MMTSQNIEVADTGVIPVAPPPSSGKILITSQDASQTPLDGTLNPIRTHSQFHFVYVPDKRKQPDGPTACEVMRNECPPEESDTNLEVNKPSFRSKWSCTGT